MKNKGIAELKKIRKETIKRWEKSGLLEGLTGNYKGNAANLFENKLSCIIDESGTTTQFSDVVFPVICRPASNNNIEK